MSRLASLTLPSFVYRLFDEHGDLLYVGITDNVKTRLSQHAAVQPWWHQVVDVKVLLVPTRKEAEQVERAAIASERPQMNIAGVVSSRSKRTLQLKTSEPLSMWEMAHSLGYSCSSVSGVSSFFLEGRLVVRCSDTPTPRQLSATVTALKRGKGWMTR